ncbi:MAG TPA: response regulator [Steroidobacteraceae bacterium]|nr:response regulator [Steroidobacteraceae bacterium]
MQTHSLATSQRLPFSAYEDVPDRALAPARLRILIVNEDFRSADSIKYALQELGCFTTLTACSARKALQAAVDFAPSLALLDLELPDMSGFELARKLRAHPNSGVRRTPLLAIAEREELGHTELTRAAGFIGCLTKPVQPVELSRILWKLRRWSSQV